MLKPNDSILEHQAHENVCAEASRILRESDVLGTFPTPVSEILSAANVEEVPDSILDASFLESKRHKAQGALRKALSKVLGLFDVVSRLIFIDRRVLLVKQNFIRLHEAGHAYLPWQGKAYDIIEECKKTLSSDIAEQFEIEANVFASEVIFQNDAFINEANDYAFSISVPRNLSNKYGASIYASIRQYVAKSHFCCTVLVVNPPKPILGCGFRAGLRRVISSESFMARFSSELWPNYFTPDDEIGKLIPIGRRAMSGQVHLGLRDRNGDRHEFTGEVFTNTYQVFILLHQNRALTSTKLII